MPSARSSRAALWIWAVIVIQGACDQPGGPPDAGAASTPGRAGLRVFLPQGWTAQATSQQELLIGPPGRSILRIDHRPGAAGLLPKGADFSSRVERAYHGLPFEITHVDESKRFVSVSFQLKGRGAHPSRIPGFVAARSLGEDLYLCATMPTIEAGELDLAVRSCRDLDVK